MKWFWKLFSKNSLSPTESLPVSIPTSNQPILKETIEWVPVWHGTGQWENSTWVSYTIFYSPVLHDFKLICRGYRADEHSVYHQTALANLFRVQRTLYQFSPEEIIQQIVENNNREGIQMRNRGPGIEQSRMAKLGDMSDEEIEDKIQDSIDREDYIEAARLQKELDKRRKEENEN